MQTLISETTVEILHCISPPWRNLVRQASPRFSLTMEHILTLSMTKGILLPISWKAKKYMNWWIRPNLRDWVVWRQESYDNLKYHTKASYQLSWSRSSRTIKNLCDFFKVKLRFLVSGNFTWTSYGCSDEQVMAEIFLYKILALYFFPSHWRFKDIFVLRQPTCICLQCSLIME